MKLKLIFLIIHSNRHLFDAWLVSSFTYWRQTSYYQHNDIILSKRKNVFIRPTYTGFEGSMFIFNGIFM